VYRPLLLSALINFEFTIDKFEKYHSSFSQLGEFLKNGLQIYRIPAQIVPWYRQMT
jgi:hypothetical protein